MRLYFVALQFLTVIPVPARLRFREGDLGRSMALFPLVGLTLGALLAGLDHLLAPLLPRPLADLLLVAVLAGVTGALHLDGLADVCDGLAARGDRERFLAVMKDSRIGAVGVVGVVLGLLLSYQALLAVPAPVKREALLIFPTAARFAQVLITVGARQARSDGLAAAFLGDAGLLQLAVASGITLAAATLLFGIPGIAGTLFLGLAVWGVRSWFQRRLGGITGDVIGCASVITEILCLLLIVAYFSRSAP